MKKSVLLIPFMAILLTGCKNGDKQAEVDVPLVDAQEQPSTNLSSH